jgi:hypothetical protein
MIDWRERVRVGSQVCLEDVRAAMVYAADLAREEDLVPLR